MTEGNFCKINLIKQIYFCKTFITIELAFFEWFLEEKITINIEKIQISFYISRRFFKAEDTNVKLDLFPSY